ESVRDAADALERGGVVDGPGQGRGRSRCGARSGGRGGSTDARYWCTWEVLRRKEAAHKLDSQISPHTTTLSLRVPYPKALLVYPNRSPVIRAKQGHPVCRGWELTSGAR